MAVELRKRAKETVSRARNHLGAKTEEGGGRIGRRKEREETRRGLDGNLF